MRGNDVRMRSHFPQLRPTSLVDLLQRTIPDFTVLLSRALHRATNNQLGLESTMELATVGQMVSTSTSNL